MRPRGRPRRGHAPRDLSPAIRPGLRCGVDTGLLLVSRMDSPRPSGRGSVAASRQRRSLRGWWRLSPAIRPGLRCGEGGAQCGHVGRLALPGHQAGAPLRHDLVIGDVATGDQLSPAIRPGLRCGGAGRVEHGDPETVSPRPSGRGSVAAAVLLHAAGVLTSTLPGHQAGAPLRQPGSAGRHTRTVQLSPAIRPGLRCGQVVPPQIPTIDGSPRPSGRGSVAAKRPCPAVTRWNPLPGHQAGAPLRPWCDDRLGSAHGDSPRPSGRGSVAARRCQRDPRS